MPRGGGKAVFYPANPRIRPDKRDFCAADAKIRRRGRPPGCGIAGGRPPGGEIFCR
jgi:hypothetical protein